MKACAICGEEFEAKSNGRFCDKCKHPKCLICGKEVELTGSRMTAYKQRGWITCSRKCGAAASKKHLMESEGVENVAQRKGVREKISKKGRERRSRYTVEERKELFGRVISEEEKEKRRSTCMERYGVPSALCLPEVHGAGVKATLTDNAKSRRREAMLANHGIENQWQDRRILDKAIDRKSVV